MAIGARPSSSIFVMQEPQKRCCTQDTSACRVSRCAIMQTSQRSRDPTSAVGWSSPLSTLTSSSWLSSSSTSDSDTEHYTIGADAVCNMDHVGRRSKLTNWRPWLHYSLHAFCIRYDDEDITCAWSWKLPENCQFNLAHMHACIVCIVPNYYFIHGVSYFSFTAFSIPAFSTLCSFVPHFPVLHFHVSHFQRPLLGNQSSTSNLGPHPKRNYKHCLLVTSSLQILGPKCLEFEVSGKQLLCCRRARLCDTEIQHMIIISNAVDDIQNSKFCVRVSVMFKNCMTAN